MTQLVTVGFIGLGDMGFPMAEKILQAGFKLVVWNRTASKMAPLLTAGAKAAASPADMAMQADVICTCVDSLAAMHDVLFGATGIVQGSGKTRTRLIIDHATLPPDESRRIATDLAESDLDYIDAPVSGGALGAREKTLAVMVGGDDAMLAYARPVLESFAGRITHMGKIGAGQATKICNQVLNFGHVSALAEALVLGHNNGVDTRKLAEAVEGGWAYSNILGEYDRSLQTQDFSPIRFLVEGMTGYYDGKIDPAYKGKLDVLFKDLGIALNMAQATNSPLPVLSHFDKVFHALDN